MTEQQYQKLGFIYLALAAIVMFVMNIPYYITKGAIIIRSAPLGDHTITYVDNGAVYSRCSGFIAYLQIAIYAVSFIGFLILIVSATKKYFKAGENKLFILPVIYLLFVVVSTFMAYNLKYAFFGRDYRYNGMLTMFSYIGLFVAASQINSRSRRKTYLDIFVSIAFINAVYGILQTVPKFIKTIPNFFYDLMLISGDEASSHEYIVADGLVQTPHALAALMIMALAVAMAGLAYDISRTRKLLYGICCPVFAAAGFATCALAAYIGIPFVVLVMLIIEIARVININLNKDKAKSKKGVLINKQKPFIGTVTAIVLIGAVFVIMYAIDRINLYDNNIIWIDSTQRLGASFPQVNEASGISIYPKMWKECLRMLKGCWIFGGGPDCIGFNYYGTSFLYNSDLGFSTDRSYNEYFDIALACGIPCLLIYLSMGFVTIKKGIKNVANFFRNEDSWTATALLGAVLGYGLQANVNISIITVSPFFFIFVGLIWNKPHEASMKAVTKGKKIKE